MTENQLILKAIASRHCIEAVYNRVRMKLAPHVLYTRHGDLFVDAAAIEKDGRTVDAPKLGTFKLAGLQISDIVERTFAPLADFDPANRKYWETTPFPVA